MVNKQPKLLGTVHMVTINTGDMPKYDNITLDKQNKRTSEEEHLEDSRWVRFRCRFILYFFKLSAGSGSCNTGHFARV